MEEERAVLALHNDVPSLRKLTCHLRNTLGIIATEKSSLLPHFNFTTLCDIAQYQNCVFSCLYYWGLNSLRTGIVTYLPLGWPSRHDCGKKGRVMLSLKHQDRRGYLKEIGAEKGN